ncbi:CDP-alcohol phosphatidyltransferase family protein [Pengzhenrongella sicca]|uniref:CDP-alcohol phosphatidyltransferase family protein n=1 Tax=Pengzhenrongella sicca TaxID=2819238 RepID=A0A8A4ZDC9_9MICO|nr:CDP-alcohol phosphatidyltransferase family protein [Pengzhenrongella sicca]QTE28893.1 CDP-alcohol phosphatidyltransferase family protein [Pengzhenrongella sicca]
MATRVLPSDESFGQTYARLATSQKGAKGAPAYSRFVNRKLGRFLATVAFRVGLTPNGVTAISAVLTFSAIALLIAVPPSVGMGIAVAAGLVLGYAFDSADGQLARLRGGGSLVGEWLDHMVDSVKVASLHLAVLVGLYRFTDLPDAWLLVPLGASAVGSVLFFAMILNDQLRHRGGAVPRSTADGTRAPVLRSLLVVPTDYGLLCLVFALYGVTTAFVVAYTVLFVATAGYLALACISWFKEISALDRPAVPGHG